MNRHWIGAVVTGLVVTLAACSNANDSRDRSAQSGSKALDSAPPITVTGCLVQGSGGNEFVLQNVRATFEKDPLQPAFSYVVVASSDKVNLAEKLNHQVEIKGRTQAAASVPNQMQAPPRLTVTDIKSVADRCTTP